jgi:hypothetical protein
MSVHRHVTRRNRWASISGSAGVNSGDLENSVGGASVFLPPSTLVMEQDDHFVVDIMRGDMWRRGTNVPVLFGEGVTAISLTTSSCLSPKKNLDTNFEFYLSSPSYSDYEYVYWHSIGGPTSTTTPFFFPLLGGESQHYSQV